MAHMRQSRPDAGLDFQVKVSKTFEVVPSLLRSGRDHNLDVHRLGEEYGRDRNLDVHRL